MSDRLLGIVGLDSVTTQLTGDESLVEGLIGKVFVVLLNVLLRRGNQLRCNKLVSDVAEHQLVEKTAQLPTLSFQIER